MAKGYWIGRLDVTDPEKFKAYAVAAAEAWRKYGGRFLVRGGSFESMEGSSRARNVVIEFNDYVTALACYRSSEYAKAEPLHRRYSVADIIVIEGYDGPQPTAMSAFPPP